MGQPYIIEAKELKDKADNAIITGIALITDVKHDTTKAGSDYINVTFQSKGIIPVKVWGNSDAYKVMNENDFTGKIVRYTGKVNHFNGSDSIVLNTVSEYFGAEGLNIAENDFFDSKYDAEAIYTSLHKILEANCDKETVSIFDSIMAEYKYRFLTEFAAHSHHDNVKSGLIAHTFKVTRLVQNIAMYPELLNRKDRKNILFLGAALHDIGKIFEYTYGSVVGNGQIVSHHTFGVEILFKHKQEIVNVKGEEFYYRLCAVIEQHHGEWAERPRTIEAYIIHLFDNVDASLTLIDQSLGNIAEDAQISVDGYKLC